MFWMIFTNFSQECGQFFLSLEATLCVCISLLYYSVRLISCLQTHDDDDDHDDMCMEVIALLCHTNILLLPTSPCM